MATSGTISWTVDRDDIITAAFQRIGVTSSGGTPSTAQVTEASLLLNGIIKSWNATFGVPLWTLKIISVLPVSGTNSITIENSIGGHVTDSYVYTTLAADGNSGNTTVTVESTSGISNTYQIGIELDNGDIHWTSVSGSPVGSVVTLSSALPGDASIGKAVYCYQTKSERPLRILYAYARHSETQYDIPLQIITIQEWLGYTNKHTETVYPLSIAYEPKIDRGILRIWPEFGNGSYIIQLYVQRAMEDFTSDTDNPDLPQEYFLPLVYELSCALAPQYGIQIDMQMFLRKEADRLLDKVLENDREEGSLYFQPKEM